MTPDPPTPEPIEKNSSDLDNEDLVDNTPLLPDVDDPINNTTEIVIIIPALAPTVEKPVQEVVEPAAKAQEPVKEVKEPKNEPQQKDEKVKQVVLETITKVPDRQINAPVVPEVDFNLKNFDRKAFASTMNRSLSELQDHDNIMGMTPTQVSLGFGTMLSAGFATWALRGGALLSALLATTPSWRGFDPLIVLVSRRSKSENEELEENEFSKVERVFEKASKAQNHWQKQS